MKSALSFLASFHKRGNFMNLLHNESGLGVKPFEYDLNIGFITAFLYSFSKFKVISLIFKIAAIFLASFLSSIQLHSPVILFLFSEKFLIKAPITLNPLFFRTKAVTAESTPPERATKT